MVFVQRDEQGRIVTYGETPFTPDDEWVALGMAAYGRRFKVSVDGQAGFTVQAAQGGGDVVVEISCPERAGGTVGVKVNGVEEPLTLDSEGRGTVILSTEVAGVFEIRPADETEFCAAGCGSLAVEVL